MKTQTELLYEAYNSVYLTEEDQYCYDIAEFLVSEGFSEEEIYALTEEENFLEILDYIEEKMTAADYRSLSRHGKKRLRQSGMKLQDPHEYKGAAGKKSREGVQSRRAGRQAWDDATARQKEIARRGRESQQRVRMAQLDAEAEKIYQDSKKKSSTERPPKTAVGRGKEYIATRAQQDTEKLKKAGETIRALASGLFARAQAGEKVKGARVAKGRTVTPEVEKRYKRREGYKAIKKALGEDYFDIVADYLLENFEFESEEHLLQTMTYLDEEVIDDILMEVKGLGGEVDPDSGEYTGRRSRAQRYRRLAGTEGARSRTYSSGSVTSGGRLSKPNSTSTMVGAGKGQGSSRHPEMKKSPLEKAKNKYDELRGRGENKRANKIAKFLERGGNRYD